MPRKTIKIARVVELANKMFESTPDKAKEHREAVFIFVSHILHETKTYNGFNYNAWLKGGFNAWMASGQPENPDEKHQFFGDMSRITMYHK